MILILHSYNAYLPSTYYVLVSFSPGDWTQVLPVGSLYSRRERRYVDGSLFPICEMGVNNTILPRGIKVSVRVR